MALGDSSSPTRFLGGQTGVTNRELTLKVFGGEVLAAFDLATVTLDKHEQKTISGGSSAQFPRTWKATSEYHVPGTELLGTDIDTAEVVITVDDILVAHTAISDLDEMLTHFEVRSKFADAMGHELAKVYDKNVFRQILLAARDAGVGGDFPGGEVITDAALTNTGTIDGSAWIDAIRAANLELFDKDIPEHLPRYMAVNARVFDALKYAKDVSGNYLVLNRDFGGDNAGGVRGRNESMEIDGVWIYKSRNIPSVDETAVTTVYSKYRANFATTTGVLWTPMAVATVKLMDIAFENERDVRRLEDFMVAKMLVGHGVLRAECAVEFKTA